MKFTATLNLNREQLNNLIHFVSYRVITRLGHEVIVSLDGDAESITRVLQEFACPLQQKIFAAKAAIEDLFLEAKNVNGDLPGVFSAFIPLELDGQYVTDHCTLFESAKDHQGIIVSYSNPE